MTCNITLLLGFLILIGSPCAFPRTFYVSPDGDNNNNGSSPATSLADIHVAVSVMGPGDTLIVMAGNYQGFHVGTSGAAGMPIVIQAEDSVFITQPNPSTNKDGISMNNASWVEVSGFNIYSQIRNGFHLVRSHHLRIMQCVADSNGGDGIHLGFCDDVEIAHNKFGYNRWGINYTNSGDRPIIHHNRVHHNRHMGIALVPDAPFGDDGIISGAQVFANIIHENGLTGGSAIDLQGTPYAQIYNNLIYHNYSTGISVNRIAANEGSHHVKIYNNTIHQYDSSRWALQILRDSDSAKVFNNIILTNNLVRGSLAIDPHLINGLQSDYNILTSRIGIRGDTVAGIISMIDWQQGGFDSNSQLSAPLGQLFVNAFVGEYELASGSPAIDVGTQIVNPPVFEDLNGLSRDTLGGSTFDIGCYEYEYIVSREPKIPAHFSLEIDKNNFYLKNLHPTDEVFGFDINGSRLFKAQPDSRGGLKKDLSVYQGLIILRIISIYEGSSFAYKLILNK